jgi:nitrate reductase assembly molybdenum cofactor insertion protein NarJ
MIIALLISSSWVIGILHKMLKKEKDAYDHALQTIVYALESLASLFSQHGMEGLYELTNPSFAELKDSLEKMKESANTLFDDIEKLVTEKNDLDAAGASVGLLNIRQGILYAESLLFAVQHKDLKRSLEAHRHVSNHGIQPNTWSNPKGDEHE